MLIKKTNSQGQKDFQRGEDKEDRSLIYRKWLRTVDCGYFCDIDFIKWKYVNGMPVARAITDLTRTDGLEVSDSYLKAIINRIFNRDSQGKILETLGKLLGVPVYLVLFPKSMKWLQVFSFQKHTWKNFTPLSWSLYLKSL